MRRKTLLIAVLVIVMIAATASVALVMQKRNSGTSNKTDYVKTEVQATGLDPLLAKIPGISLDIVNTSILGAIRKNVESPKESYDANYRNDSFLQSQTPTGGTIYSFLVDIPDAQRTFLIQVEKSPGGESMPIYTLCPEPGQSAYGEKACNVTP